jgi:hypothetical protein
VPQNSDLVAVTVHPAHVSPAILKTIKPALRRREPEGRRELRRGDRSAAAAGTKPKTDGVKEGEVVAWSPASRDPPVRIEVTPAGWVHRRHGRKYAHGDLGPDRSFYFRGPHGKLKLRAQNLVFFLQIAEGVDESTWLFHLRRGDYSRWFRENIKDENLARSVERIEQSTKATAVTTRSLVRRAIEERYTLPA